MANCGNFFTYQLSPLDTCNSAYCFGKTIHFFIHAQMHAIYFLFYYGKKDNIWLWISLLKFGKTENIDTFIIQYVL